MCLCTYMFVCEKQGHHVIHLNLNLKYNDNIECKQIRLVFTLCGQGHGHLPITQL